MGLNHTGGFILERSVMPTSPSALESGLESGLESLTFESLCPSCFAPLFCEIRFIQYTDRLSYDEVNVLNCRNCKKDYSLDDVIEIPTEPSWFREYYESSLQLAS